MKPVERAVRAVFDDPYARPWANEWLLGRRDSAFCWEAWTSLRGYHALVMFAAAYDAQGQHKMAEGIANVVNRELGAN